jgi:hypothetical protein
VGDNYQEDEEEELNTTMAWPKSFNGGSDAEGGGVEMIELTRADSSQESVRIVSCRYEVCFIAVVVFKSFFVIDGALISFDPSSFIPVSAEWFPGRGQST